MALEGMYVKPGMKLYTIADLSRVWVYVDIYEYQLPWVRIGQTATMTLPYIPGKGFAGEVVYIYPYLEQQTRVIKVRLEFENEALELKPEMYASVMLAAELGRDALLIPREAYVDSGVRKLAFVDLGGGRFQPREIQVGVEGEDGMVEVLYGLDEGDVVVTSGQFMLDAESKLKEAVAKMMEASRTPSEKKPQGGGTASEHARHDPHAGHQTPTTQPATTVPRGAEFACPMERHPDEADPANRGPYFASEPGRCPRCGMTLKPVGELAWALARQAAKGGDVAYTCPDHQHVFSRASGKCPRCSKNLEPFKVMYTCPDPQHAGVVSTLRGRCPHCSKELARFRGVWLGEEMAEANVPPTTQPAAAAAYRCPVHPLVHSDVRGACTICAAPLAAATTQPTMTEPTGKRLTRLPADARFVCPMQECQAFAAEPGQCPTCGMGLKPIEQVEWARKAKGMAPAPPRPDTGFVCPMHPEQARSDTPGICAICAMQLVPAKQFKRPTTAPARVRQELDYVTEHYLALHRLLASDSTKDVARHALGVAAASSEMLKHLAEWDTPNRDSIADAAGQLHAAALKITGRQIEHDRVPFVQLSAAMVSLLDYLRPNEQRWPKLIIFHCPMTKADWIQASEETANPYYGFKMLDCGRVKQTK